MMEVPARALIPLNGTIEVGPKPVLPLSSKKGNLDTQKECEKWEEPLFGDGDAQCIGYGGR